MSVYIVCVDIEVDGPAMAPVIILSSIRKIVVQTVDLCSRIRAISCRNKCYECTE